MKKLMESFKTYEHVLSEDIVTEHFRSIINKVLNFDVVPSLLTYYNFVTMFFNFRN